MDRAPELLRVLGFIFTLGYWTTASFLVGSSAATSGFGLWAVMWGLGHVLALRPVHRHTRRATVVIGCLLVAWGISMLWGTPRRSIDLLLGLALFALFDLVFESLFWSYSLTGIAKTFVHLKARRDRRRLSAT